MTGMTGFWSAAGIFSTTPATAVTASKAIRLRRFKDELMILIYCGGAIRLDLRIDYVEKLRRSFRLVKQIFRSPLCRNIITVGTTAAIRPASAPSCYPFDICAFRRLDLRDLVNSSHCDIFKTNSKLYKKS